MDQNIYSDKAVHWVHLPPVLLNSVMICTPDSHRARVDHNILAFQVTAFSECVVAVLFDGRFASSMSVTMSYDETSDVDGATGGARASGQFESPTRQQLESKGQHAIQPTQHDFTPPPPPLPLAMFGVFYPLLSLGIICIALCGL